MQAVHPRVKVISLLVFAVLLPWQATSGLCVAAFWIAFLLLLDRDVAIDVLRGIRRIRFLLLSLAVLYLFFTPGEPLIGALGDWSPSWQGLALMVERTGILLLMLLAALLVIRSTQREALSDSLQHLLQPACRIGMLPSRLPQRIALVFEQLSATESAVRTARKSEGSIFERAATLWVEIETSALQAGEGTQRETGEPDPVPMLQWILPIVILVTGSALMIAGQA